MIEWIYIMLIAFVFGWVGHGAIQWIIHEISKIVNREYRETKLEKMFK